jgi:amidophosphoribosyltransferase
MQGVVGVYSKQGACTKSLQILYGVQHRGQESSGLTAAGDNSLRTWKGKGLASGVFGEQFRSFMHPNDYAVIGCSSGENAENGYPPHESRRHSRFIFSVALDGYFPRGGRTNEEVVAETINSLLCECDGFGEALAETMRRHRDAYYSLVACVWDMEERESRLYAARDERGVRPLYVATNDASGYVASESAPIDVLESMGEHFTLRRDVTPGSMLRIDEHGVEETQVLEPRPAHCVFEWVYFGRPDSVIEGRTVHAARKALGHALVELHGLREEYGITEGKADDLVVIPVPDSGRSVCTGVAEGLGVIADEGVIKNAYMGRTYIIDDPEFRKLASDLKHNTIRETVDGKKVIITDDSIVRGTVSESVAQNLVKAGAREVEFLVSYAPIFYPCFSDPQDKPLAARPYRGKSLGEIGDLVSRGLPSINRVRYNDEEHVLEAVGLPRDHVCTYCISGRDPFLVRSK